MNIAYEIPSDKVRTTESSIVVQTKNKHSNFKEILIAYESLTSDDEPDESFYQNIFPTPKSTGVKEKRRNFLQRDDIFEIQNSPFDFQIQKLSLIEESNQNDQSKISTSPAYKIIRFSPRLASTDLNEFRNGLKRVETAVNTLKRLKEARFVYDLEKEYRSSKLQLIDDFVDLKTIQSNIKNLEYSDMNELIADLEKYVMVVLKLDPANKKNVRNSFMLAYTLIGYIEHPKSKDPIRLFKHLKQLNSLQLDKLPDKDNENMETDSDSDELVSGYTSKPDKVPIQPSVVFFNDEKGYHDPDPEFKKYKDSSCLNYSPHLWWKKACRKLACEIVKREDSALFRNPIDIEKYPDYKKLVTLPIDFGYIKKKIMRDEYASFRVFNNDCQRVFQNAKIYFEKKDPGVKNFS
jgi:hypothetical protein